MIDFTGYSLPDYVFKRTLDSGLLDTVKLAVIVQAHKRRIQHTQLQCVLLIGLEDTSPIYFMNSLTKILTPETMLGKAPVSQGHGHYSN